MKAVCSCPIAIRHDQLAAVGQLAAGLAHELRNPLMSVKLIVQTAAERDGHELKQTDLTVIEDEITRLEALLQSFLDFARPPTPRRHDVDVGQLIKRTVHVVRPRAIQQQVRLHFKEGDQILIAADESQLRQLLLNLLLNALDALPTGGNVWLDVHTEDHSSCHGATEAAMGTEPIYASRKEQPAAGPHLVICISDDGPGFSDDLKEQAFEPFISTKDTGIGLGLSICSQIVESHGGRIIGGNRPEGGAQVTTILPLRTLKHDVETMASAGKKTKVGLG